MSITIMTIPIRHKCGHSSTQYLSGKLSERAKKIEAAELRDCSECAGKEMQKQQAFKF